jgi:hypothetical protein
MVFSEEQHEWLILYATVEQGAVLMAIKTWSDRQGFVLGVKEVWNRKKIMYQCLFLLIEDGMMLLGLQWRSALV